MKIQESFFVFRGLGQSIKINARQAIEKGLLQTEAETLDASTIAGLPAINVQGKILSQMPPQALAAVIAGAAFDPQLYEGYSYTEELSGKVKSWCVIDGQLVSERGEAVPLPGFIVDPLVLIFNLTNLVNRPELWVLAGSKLYVASVAGAGENQVVLSVHNRKISIQVDSQGLVLAKLRILPLLEFALQRLP